MSLSFKPHTYKANIKGEAEIDSEASVPYIILGSQTQGTLYYVAKENKYYASEGKEMPQARFNKSYLPFLHWDFDKVDEKGVNSFPPTTDNIAIKRKELIQKAVESGKVPNIQDIYNATSPTLLSNTENFEKALADGNSVDQNLIRRLKGF